MASRNSHNAKSLFRHGLHGTGCSAAWMLAAFGMGASAHAATYVWNGSVSGVWSDSGNWSNTDGTATASVPDADDAVQFLTTSSQTTIDIGTSLSALMETSLTFSTNATFGNSVSAYTIGAGAAGSQTLIFGGRGGTINLTSAATSNQIFNAKVQFGDGTGGSWTHNVLNGSTTGQTLTFNGGIDVRGGTGIQFGGTGDIILNGDLAAFQGRSLIKNGTGHTTFNGDLTNVSSSSTGRFSPITVNDGTLTLNGFNRYTGGTVSTRINGGTLEVVAIADGGATTSSIGQSSAAADLVLAGGTLKFIGGANGSTARLFSLAYGANNSSSVINASGNVPLQLTGIGDIGAASNTVSTNGNRATGSTVLTMTDVSRLAVGMGITGTRIQSGTYITAINGNDITLSQATSGGTLNSGTGLQFFGGPRTLTLDGTNTGANTLAANLTDAAASNGSQEGLLSHAANLVKQGAGTWSLTGVNTYSGGTTIAAGTLLVNNTSGSGTGSGAVGVGAAGTIGGSGTIAGALTVNGTLAPGNSAGRLTVTNNVTLGSTAVFKADVNGTTAGVDYDQLTLNGDFTLQLGGTLLVTMGAFTASEGQMIYLIDNAGPGATTGTFTGLAEGSAIASLAGVNGFDWHITYSAVYGNPEGNSNDVAIYSVNAVPEPGALGLIALGGAALLRRRRRNAC